jgi:anti-anti-sigma factor
MATAPSLDAALDQAFAERAVVTVDVTHLRFMDSTGINVLVRARKRLRSVDGDLVLRGALGHIKRVLEMCGLQDFLSQRARRS